MPTSFYQRFLQRATTSKVFLPNPSTTSHLSRTLNKFDVTLVGVGASIGAGIFVVSGEAAKMAGPAVVLSFFIAAVVCVLNALCYAEMASRIPVSGSAYVYSMSVFGEFVAIITGLNLLFDYHIGAALIARNLVHYLLKLLEAMGVPTLPTWLNSITVVSVPFLSFSFTAPFILMGLAVLLCMGMKESARVNNVMTGLKIFIVLLVIAGGCTKVDTSNWEPFVPQGEWQFVGKCVGKKWSGRRSLSERSPLGPTLDVLTLVCFLWFWWLWFFCWCCSGTSSIFRASSLVFFAYIGFDAVCNTAEECVAPETTLPFGIVVSLMICACLYAGVTLVLTGLLAFDQLPADASLSAAFEGKNMDWILIVIDVGAVIGLTTTLFLGN